MRGEIARQLAAYKYVEPEKPSEIKPPQLKEIVWIDDDMPEGAQTQERWKFAGKPQPVYSGTKSLERKSTGPSQWYFERAAKPLAVAQGDRGNSSGGGESGPLSRSDGQRLSPQSG